MLKLTLTQKLFLILAFITIVILISVRYFYHQKPIHFSIDDVTICLENLTRDSNQYFSPFQEPFFATLQKMHNRTGAKFTLYIFEQYGDFNISKIPEKYSDEFKNNNNWLRFGFHAPFPKSTTDSVVFMQSYLRTDSCIKSKLGGNKTSTLRLDYFRATKKEIEALRKQGITTLLAADDNRLSYSVTPKQNAQLLSSEKFNYNTIGGVVLKHTDARIEMTSPLTVLVQNANDEELVIFTHECCFYENTKEINMYLFFFYLTGCIFTY